MKKFSALLLIACLSLTTALYAYALYESELGPAPESPMASYVLTAPQYAAAGSTVYVTISVNDIALKDGAALFDFRLYWDETKVTPVIENNPATLNAEMNAFVVSQPSNWENLFSMKTEGGKRYYNLATIAEPGASTAKANGAVSLRIPFKVKADAEGDMLFYIPNGISCFCTDESLVPKYPAKGSYAVCEVKSSVTVSFDTRGGSAITPVSVTVGATLPRPQSPSRDGYVFYGWYTSDDITALYDFSKPVMNDMTLYAGYIREKYTVSFDTNGGSSISSQTVAFESTASVPSTPVRDGYTFTGWFTDAGCTAKYDFSAKVTGSLTLYAGWNKDPVNEVSDDVSDVNSGDTSDPDVSGEVSGEVSSEVSDEVSNDVSEVSNDASESVSDIPDLPSGDSDPESADSVPEASEGDAKTPGIFSGIPSGVLIALLLIIALTAIGGVLYSVVKSKIQK